MFITKSKLRKTLFLLGASIILLAVFALLSKTLTQNVEPQSASLFFQFRNISNQTLDPMVHLWIVDLKNSKNMNFSDATTFPISQNTTERPFYVTKTADGSGLTLYARNLTEGSCVGFQVDNIGIDSETLSDIHALRIYADPVEPLGSTQMEYELVLSIFGTNPLGYFSLASICSFTQEIREGVVTSPYYLYRAQGSEYTIFFCIGLYLVSLGILFLFVYPEPTKKWFPFATFTLLVITACLYVFAGSGWEKAHLHPLADYEALTRGLSVFFHGYDGHITGNLFYFIPLSILMETWMRLRRDIGTFIGWYVFPLLLPLFIGGFGLSLSIESMTWVLWARIILEERKKKKVDLLLTIFSGIPSIVFFGWFHQILFSRSTIPYYQSLELLHVAYGLVTLVGLLVIAGLVYRKQLIRFVLSLPKPMEKKDEEPESKGKITFMSIMRMDDLDEKVRNIIAERNLTLAGFTLTALAFIIGFHKENLATASILILPLMLAMFLFFLGSQLAHEAEFFWQIFFADVCQYFGVMALMVSFYHFISKNLQDSILVLFPILLVVILAIFLTKGLWGIIEFYKDYRKRKEVSKKG